MAERKEITETVLKEISRAETGRGTTVIRIVVWGKGSPQLEKREQYETEEGTRSGKAKGFSKDDFDLLLENQEEIKKLLGGSK